MYQLKIRVQLPDGTFTKLPLAVQFKGEEEKVIRFKTWDEAIEWVSCCLPGSPDIVEIDN